MKTKAREAGETQNPRCPSQRSTEETALTAEAEKEKETARNDEAKILRARELILKLNPGAPTPFETYAQECKEANHGKEQDPQTLSDQWNQLTQLEKRTYQARADFRRREWEAKYDRFQSRLQM